MAAGIFLDVGNSALVTPSFAPVVLTTTTNGAPVDLVDSNANVASALLDVGAVNATSGTCDVKMQECATTNGTWSDIPGATFAQVTTSGVAGVSGSQVISFQRQKRYVRAYAVLGGTFTNMLIGVSVFSQRAVTPDAKGGWVNEAGAS